MTKKEIHHIQMHYGAQAYWWALAGLYFVGWFFWMSWRLERIGGADEGPYVIDLRKEQFPTSFDYASRRDLVVRVEKPDGVEVRFYDPVDGELLGSIIEPHSPDDSRRSNDG